MASIRKRGENSYLLVVSRGYDYQGNRLKPAQKTVHPPKGLTAKQTEKWLNEQAVLYEREVKRTPGEPVDRSITLAKYIDVWLEQVAPKKLAASTLVRDKQDIRRILPALGHYKLAELNKDILRAFYDAMRSEQNWKTGGLLAEKTVEGIHSCLCGILSDAVEAGYITHNPAWRAYRKKADADGSGAAAAIFPYRGAVLCGGGIYPLDFRLLPTGGFGFLPLLRV